MWSARIRADSTIMIWTFAKGAQRMSCESREAMLWYELVITSPDGVARVERYTERAQLLRRQHELLCAWKAQGWQEIEPAPALASRR
jgi:hypothetical protein